jgi:mannose-6-phosphate isomerase
LTVERVRTPWGWCEVWADVPLRYTAKLLEVDDGARLSLQYHRKKHETMRCLAGEGELLVADHVVPLVPGVVCAVPPRTVHRLCGVRGLQVVEVSTWDHGDVVRMEDDYGRV